MMWILMPNTALNYRHRIYILYLGVSFGHHGEEVEVDSGCVVAVVVAVAALVNRQDRADCLLCSPGQIVISKCL